MALQHLANRRLPPGPCSSLESHRGQGVLKMSSIHLLPEPQASLNIFQKFLHVSSLHGWFFSFPIQKIAGVNKCLQDWIFDLYFGVNS